MTSRAHQGRPRCASSLGSGRRRPGSHPERHAPNPLSARESVSCSLHGQHATDPPAVSRFVSMRPLNLPLGGICPGEPGPSHSALRNGWIPYAEKEDSAPRTAERGLRSPAWIATMRRRVAARPLGGLDGATLQDDEFHRIRPRVATMSRSCVIVPLSAGSVTLARWTGYGTRHRGEQHPDP
jgi:hypothetical protein